MGIMRLVGNILWHIPFLGFISAGIAFVLGTILTVLVVTAPIGFGLLQYSKFLLAPFSYSLVDKGELSPEVVANQHPLFKTYGAILKIVYVVCLGIWLAIGLFFQAIGLCCTVIGIPAGIAVFKSIPTVLQPVGKVCVPVGVANHLDAQKDAARAADYMSKYS